MYDSDDSRKIDVGSTSSKLIQNVHANNPVAWVQMVEIYGPLVYGWCRKHGLQASCAADVAQEVLKSVFGNMGGFSLDVYAATFRGWLWTITKNKIQDYHRRNHRQPVAQGGSDAQKFLGNLSAKTHESDSQSATGGDREVAAMLNALESIRGDFTDQTWNAFWLVTVENCTSQMAASELGMTANAVRLAKGRVIRRLRSCLKQECNTATSLTTEQADL